MPTLANFLNLGGFEFVIIAVLGLLIFGKRLPEVGKSLGKGIVEFKKGLSGVEDDVRRAGDAPTEEQHRLSAPPPTLSAEEQLRQENARLRAQLDKTNPGA